MADIAFIETPTSLVLTGGFMAQTKDIITGVFCFTKAIGGQFVAYIWHVYSGEKYFTNWYQATPQSLSESDLFEHINIEK